MTDIVEPFALVFEVFWSGNGVLLAGQKFCKGGQRHSLPIIFNTSITNNCCGLTEVVNISIFYDTSNKLCYRVYDFSNGICPVF